MTARGLYSLRYNAWCKQLRDMHTVFFERRIHESMLELIMIRHGRTKGNIENRYIGTTDEPLLASEAERLSVKREKLKEAGMLHPDVLCASPMRRCRETAAVLFPESEPVIVPDFRECDFGEFENKNYQELSGNADYQRWIDSGGRLPFPGGESMRSFQERVCRAFGRQIREIILTSGNQRSRDAKAAMVVHGGTIMAVLERYGYPRKSYFDWHVGNGDGFLLSVRKTGEDLLLSVTGSF